MINDGNFRIILILLVLTLAGMGVSLFVTRFMKNKYAWNIPSIGGIVLITYLGHKIKYGNLEGFADLAYFLLIIMTIAFIIGNSFSNLIIYKKIKSKKPAIKVEEKEEENLE